MIWGIPRQRHGVFDTSSAAGHSGGEGPMMRRPSRRHFLQGSLILAGLGLLAACSLPPYPAQPVKVPVVGFLYAASQDASQPVREAFRQGLRELGYVEGQNIVLEYRFADGRDERLP